MSKRNKNLFIILFVVLWWFFLSFGFVFFIDVFASDYRWTWFHITEESYPMMRIIQPLFSGVLILYFWAKAEYLKNTSIAWLAFAFIVAAMFIYTVATYSSPNADKPITICDNNGENCRPHPVYGVP